MQGSYKMQPLKLLIPFLCCACRKANLPNPQNQNQRQHFFQIYIQFRGEVSNILLLCQLVFLYLRCLVTVHLVKEIYQTQDIFTSKNLGEQIVHFQSPTLGRSEDKVTNKYMKSVFINKSCRSQQHVVSNIVWKYFVETKMLRSHIKTVFETGQLDDMGLSFKQVEHLFEKTDEQDGDDPFYSLKESFLKKTSSD